ncbi:malonyl-ACP O-methyltransferase BioC [Arenimonas sp. GDDSR-1]|uniref:malonyl-ACP O-methyltransferase BioC n=1 Tax=Arenimonas sp. GDDSR-1 TaxID=2950125 RepID=UPI002618B6CE|nr:malonyl-ACP O-methyltransferase BioC [Arenimonas sp. GDDSR-1]
MPEHLFDRRGIKRHFARAADSYLAAAALQKEVEARLLEQADYLETAPKRILDLGSGPGRAAGLLKKRWPKAEVIAMDIALPMLRQVPRQTRFWRPVKRVCADALQLPFRDGSFDFIFSSLCLQWVHPLPDALRDIRRVLAPGGLFAFSSFGPDTLMELREAYAGIGEAPPVSPFAAIQQVGDAMQGAGFRNSVLERELYTMHYPDLRALMQELQAIGATDARPQRPRGLAGKSRWQAINAAYPVRDGRIASSWEVISAMAFRPAQDPVPREDGIVASIDPGQIRRRIR